MAALSRIAANIHSKVSIVPGDLVILSSSPIPGNEKAVNRVINELEMKGAKVIYHDTHVSGHACQEELKLMYALTKPKYSIPVHGEYQHLHAHKDLAITMGIPKDKVVIMKCGDVLELSEESAEIVGRVPAESIFVDGLGVGDVGNIVLRDRQQLSQNGLMVVVVTMEKETGRILAGPDIVSRGFVYVRESETLIEDARHVVSEALMECESRNITAWARMKTMIRDSLGEFLWKRIKRNPMILPIISEV
jgi:ribonuclease J